MSGGRRHTRRNDGTDRHTVILQVACGERVFGHGSSIEKAQRDAKGKLKSHKRWCRECKLVRK